MPHAARTALSNRSLERQFTAVERALRTLNRSIDAQVERARDLEVEQAVTLYRAGKATLHDGSEVIQQARRRVG
jgi:exonuclease VII small subunit